jgi:hypothetical protein
MHTTAARIPRPGADALQWWGGLMTRPEPSGPGAMSMFATLTGVAVMIAVLVAGGVGLGYLLDQAVGTGVFVFAGLVLGVLVAFLATRSIVKRYFGS